MSDQVPGWEGSVGPFLDDYGKPHVYARDVHSGAGNCVCGAALHDPRHVQAAPGVPIPDRTRAPIDYEWWIREWERLLTHDPR